MVVLLVLAGVMLTLTIAGLRRTRARRRFTMPSDLRRADEAQAAPPYEGAKEREAISEAFGQSRSLP